MKLGLYLRNMGPQSTREVLIRCAQHAQALGIDDLWLADHIAIPPDQSEDSGGIISISWRHSPFLRV